MMVPMVYPPTIMKTWPGPGTGDTYEMYTNGDIYLRNVGGSRTFVGHEPQGPVYKQEPAPPPFKLDVPKVSGHRVLPEFGRRKWQKKRRG